MRGALWQAVTGPQLALQPSQISQILACSKTRVIADKVGNPAGGTQACLLFFWLKRHDPSQCDTLLKDLLHCYIDTDSQSPALIRQEALPYIYRYIEADKACVCNTSLSNSRLSAVHFVVRIQRITGRDRTLTAGAI